MYLYALALNKTFSNGQDPKNGTAVFNHMKRTQFESKSNYLARTYLVFLKEYKGIGLQRKPGLVVDSKNNARVNCSHVPVTFPIA